LSTVSIAIPVNERRPAPFLVCTYSFGEGALPTVRAAVDLGQAADFAHAEACASCQPTVRVYAVDPDGVCSQVMMVRT
jgi:hypothetical protein